MRLTCFVQLMGDSGIRPEGESEYNPNEASLIDRCGRGTLRSGIGPCPVSCFFAHIWVCNAALAHCSASFELCGDGGGILNNATQRLPSGACGAFVQALEDQYLEVRMAAVDAMGELATHCWVWRSIASKICLSRLFRSGLCACYCSTLCLPRAVLLYAEAGQARHCCGAVSAGVWEPGARLSGRHAERRD
jgi:hypothetical protein